MCQIILKAMSPALPHLTYTPKRNQVIEWVAIMCLIPSVFQILLSWEPKLTASSSEVLTL